MKIVPKCSIKTAAAGGYHPPGQAVDLPAAEAKALIEKGLAEPVNNKKPDATEGGR